MVFVFLYILCALIYDVKAILCLRQWSQFTRIDHHRLCYSFFYWVHALLHYVVVINDHFFFQLASEYLAFCHCGCTRDA